MLDALRQVPLFAGLIDGTSDCVPFLKQGVERRLDTGEILVREGDAVEHFYILLDGEMQITKNVGGQETVLTTYGPGTFFGEVPLLMDSPYVATGRALCPSRVFGLSLDLFWQMLGACSATRRVILRKMAERIHDLEAVAQGREKLAALGTLAAGFAHELNNPASAARRAVGQLRDRLADARPPENVAPDVLDAIRQDARTRQRGAPARDVLSQSDAEDSLGDWLTERGAERGWDLAPSLVAAGLDREWLASLDAALPPGATPAVAAWLASSLTVESLLDEMEHSTARISELVEAIKSYSFMDQALVQEVDIHDGLEDTLTMLHPRLEEGSLEISRDYDRTLPLLTVYGVELNQVWTGLLNNAFDSLKGCGHIWVRTVRESDYALVEIRDDGPGIAPDVLPRIFEPFFTTKNIGDGKGLGLDASYRIVVGRHRGDIRVDSRPGDTRFQVRIPLAGVGREP